MHGLGWAGKCYCYPAGVHPINLIVQQTARYSHCSTERGHMVDPGILMGSPDCQVFTLPHGARTQEWRTCDQEPLPVLNATTAQRIGHGKDSLVISFLEYQFFDCLCPVQFHTPHQLSTSQLGNPNQKTFLIHKECRIDFEEHLLCFILSSSYSIIY